MLARCPGAYGSLKLAYLERKDPLPKPKRREPVVV
jgi:hypothetical protein